MRWMQDQEEWYLECNEKALKWSKEYYEKCMLMEKASSCTNAKLRYKGCQYVLKKATAQELYSSTDGTYTVFDYLSLAIYQKNSKDFTFFRSKLDVDNLQTWEQRTLKELDERAP